MSDGFEIKDGAIRPVNEQVFTEDPERLIRVFRHAQQAGASIDIELRRMIRNSAPLIDKKRVNSPAPA